MPPSRTSVRKTVEFAETDAAGLVHFSNYLRYMEIAERAFFESIGFDLFGREGERLVGFPRVRVRCDYSAPLRFRDVVEITLTLKEVGDRSLRFAFRFDRIEGEQRQRVARGELATVYAYADAATGAMIAAKLPPALQEKLTTSLGAENAPPP